MHEGNNIYEKFTEAERGLELVENWRSIEVSTSRIIVSRSQTTISDLVGSCCGVSLDMDWSLKNSSVANPR